MMAFHLSLGFGGESTKRFAVFGTELRQKVSGDGNDVISTFVEGGDLHLDNCKPVVEILSEKVFLYHGIQILVGG